MVMLEKIAVAIDFSEASRQALSVARRLADACEASLHLVHVVRCQLGHDMADLERTDRRKQLQAMLDDEDRVKRHATTSCITGPVASSLSEFVSNAGIDLLVMGTHPHGPSFQMAKGSIAESVLGLVPCAVLAVKTPDAAREPVFDPPASVTTAC
jgi:nucleotide-binding universal stress UspA family protein